MVIGTCTITTDLSISAEKMTRCQSKMIPLRSLLSCSLWYSRRQGEWSAGLRGHCHGLSHDSISSCGWLPRGRRTTDHWSPWILSCYETRNSSCSLPHCIVWKWSHAPIRYSEDPCRSRESAMVFRQPVVVLSERSRSMSKCLPTTVKHTRLDGRTQRVPLRVSQLP